MQRLGGKRRRYELVVHTLVDHLFAPLSGITVRTVANGGPWVAEHGVNLVEREPVLDQVSITSEAGLCKADKEVDDAAVVPAVIVIG